MDSDRHNNTSKSFVKFHTGNSKYVAFGSDPYCLTVHEITERSPKKLKMKYYSSDKLTGPVEVEAEKSGPSYIMNAKIEAEFGEFPAIGTR